MSNKKVKRELQPWQKSICNDLLVTISCDFVQETEEAHSSVVSLRTESRVLLLTEVVLCT